MNLDESNDLEETHLTLLTKNHVATLKSSERSKL
jgi:hypothetical protein